MLNVNGGVTPKKYIIETTGSGVAVIDYDRDGWPDIFVVNGTTLDPHVDHDSTSPTGHLYHNNHDGTFRVTLRVGQAQMAQEVRSASSYLSSSDLRLHFGLGRSTQVDAIKVRWPNGETEEFPGTNVDRFLTSTEGTTLAPPSATRRQRSSAR